VTNDLKLKIYPAVIGILGLCLIASLFANVEIQVARNAPTDRRQPAKPDESPIASPVPAPTQVPTPVPTPIPSPTVSATPLSPDVLATAQGSLRVSNQTEYPLRVALLQPVPVESEPEAGAEAAEPSETDPIEPNQPVHWDFAPREGSNRGLILSLPNQTLQLQPGDVLVAFAQDGSRRYWGPYIVGQSPFPTWNAEAKEWQLTLQP
jgi:hypothetical protein